MRRSAVPFPSIFALAVIACAMFAAPALAQVLPLPGVNGYFANKDYFGGSPEVRVVTILRTERPFGQDISGGSKDGHPGYIPTGPTAEAKVCTDGSVDTRVEQLNGLGYDVIVLKGEDAKRFYEANPKTGGPLPGDVDAIVIIDPKDKDFKGVMFVLFGYDKDGCMWGSANWPRSDVEKALEAYKAAEPAPQA